MERTRIIFIAIVAVVVVVGILAWALWPSGEDEPSKQPVGGNTTITLTPTASPTPTPSSTVSAPMREMNFELTVLPEDGPPLTAEGSNKVMAAHDFLMEREGLDYSKPYPGFDYERLMALSTGNILASLEGDAMLWENPRTQDIEGNEEANALAEGGVFKVDVKVNEVWLNDGPDLVVIDIDTTNTLPDHFDELVEMSYYLNMEPCDSNEYGFCVASVDDHPTDG